MITLLRPDIIKVERKVKGALSPTGEQTFVITTIHDGLSAGINSQPVVSGQGGNFEVRVSNVEFLQTHLIFVDGLPSARFKGLGVDTSIAVNGVSYKINTARTAAFPDITQDDRITDQNGDTYLVLASARYTVINPSLQLRCVFGAAWS